MNTEKTSVPAYHGAVVDTLVLYDKSPAKSDEILSAQFVLSYKNRPFRRICQFIFLTVLRNKILIDTVIGSLCAKKPKPKITAILRAAAAELMDYEPERAPKIIHSWVNYAKSELSKSESGFINAVMRKFPAALEKLRSQADFGEDAEKLPIVYSHPKWLVERWIKEFGAEKTLEILKNNLKPSEVFLRKSPTSEADALLSKNSGFLQASKYPNFYILKPGHWQDVSELLQTPHFYIQDPSTFHAPELLDPAPGEKCLDLCAAPGGKSRAIADIIKGKISDNPNAYAPDVRSETLIVSVDFGERRMKTLRENMGKLKFPKSVCLDCDLCGDSLPEVLSEYELPEFYDAVLLDAPCSNTGVLRRRPDAKYRLSPSDLDKCAKIQAKILRVAAEHLKPGGRLVYSTCSIEPCENIEIVEEFLKTHSDFRLVGCKKIFPSEQSDGASAFLLKKNA